MTKILIADDNVVARNLLKFYLKKYNVEIKEAKDGLEVLRAFQSMDYNILFLDLSMPNLDGLNVANYLSKCIDTVDIIAVSATLDNIAIRKFKSVGVEYFLPKPIDKNKLDEIMPAILSKDFSHS